MREMPEIRYVRNNDVSIAYSRWGQGEQVILFTPPLVSNIELMWDLAEWDRAFEWVGQHCQMILIDKRGVGLSDRILEPPTLDENVSDVLAVMDAENLQSVNIVGQSEGAVIGVALAANHPDRVEKLCLVGTLNIGFEREILSSFLKEGERLNTAVENRKFWIELIRTWGQSNTLRLEKFAPSATLDSRVARWWSKFERQSSSPGSLAAMLRGFDSLNIVHLAKKIRAPTLVCHSAGDLVAHVACGRAIASIIAGAKFIEWQSPDHLWSFTSNWRESANDFLEFIAGSRPGAGARKQMATVLFTDIVDSTKHASELGNSGWRKIMELHNSITAARVADHEGDVIKSTGDGTLAIFPDPISAVSAGLELSQDIESTGISIRAGLHTGQIEVHDDGDISGIAVNIAARVQALAIGREVLVSQTVRDMLMGSSVIMSNRGEHQLKGVDGMWRVYAASL